MTKSRIIALIVLVATIIVYLLGYQRYIGSLPVLLVNGSVYFATKDRVNKSAIFLISSMIIILTIIVQIIAIVLQFDEIVGIICLMVNSVICISCYDRKSEKKDSIPHRHTRDDSNRMT